MKVLLGAAKALRVLVGLLTSAGTLVLALWTCVALGIVLWPLLIDALQSISPWLLALLPVVFMGFMFGLMALIRLALITLYALGPGHAKIAAFFARWRKRGEKRRPHLLCPFLLGNFLREVALLLLIIGACRRVLHAADMQDPATLFHDLGEFCIRVVGG